MQLPERQESSPADSIIRVDHLWMKSTIHPDTAAGTYLNLVQTNSFDRQSPYLPLYCLIGNGGNCAENHSRLGLHIFYQLTDILGVDSVQGQVGDRPGLAHLHRLLCGVKKYQDPCLCTLLLYGDERKDAKRHLPCGINMYGSVSAGRGKWAKLLLKLTTVAEQGVGQRHKGFTAPW